MVNACAIAIAELMEGASPDEHIANMLALFSDLAGRARDRRVGVPLGAGDWPLSLSSPRHSSILKSPLTSCAPV
jgi:hypothetical protein